MNFINKNKNGVETKNIFKRSSISSQNSAINSKIDVSNLQSNQVLKNTQCLTQFENLLTIKINFQQIQFEEFYEIIDTGALCKLIVQNIYLLHICYLFKMKIYISREFYVEKSKFITNTNNFNIFQLFCFQNDLRLEKSELNIKGLLVQNKFHKFFQYQQTKIQDFYFILEKFVKKLQKYCDWVKSNQKKHSSDKAEVQLNRKYLEQFVKIYKNIIFPQKQRVTDPKYLIKLLEQSKLFRSHSFLTKIVNNSLFYSIKVYNSQLINKLRLSVLKLKKLLAYGKEAQFGIQKQVQKQLDKFFINLVATKAIQIPKSFKQLPNEENYLMENKSLYVFQEQMQNQNDYKVPSTLTGTIIISQPKYTPISEELFESILNNKTIPKFEGDDKQLKIEKDIELDVTYVHSSNQIRITCITDVDFNGDNRDYLTYLMNSFNEGINSVIVVDTIDKFRKSFSKKKEKVLSLKLNYKTNRYEQPLLKILELIDVITIASKIFLAELSKRSYVKPEEYSKRQKLCQMFRHYENIICNPMKKFYSEILSSVDQ